jgi:hypothetical protein
MQLGDASGVQGSWLAADAALPASVMGLLQLAGEVYLPFLLANAAAAAAGQETFRFEAWGLPYEQGVFKYQVRCLADLRSTYQSLSAPVRARVDQVLPDLVRSALSVTA